MTDAIQKAREALEAAREALRADNMFTLSAKIDAALAALEQVMRERDEARATLDEVCLSSRQEWQRATSAEAKLAEARKVIERYESGLNTLATTFYKDDQHQDYAKHVLDIRNLEPRHD